MKKTICLILSILILTAACLMAACSAGNAPESSRRETESDVSLDTSEPGSPQDSSDTEENERTEETLSTEEIDSTEGSPDTAESSAAEDTGSASGSEPASPPSKESIRYDTDFSVNSESFCILDENGNITAGKNEFELLAPASITKVMTALVAVEQGDLDEPALVEEEDLRDVDLLSSGVYPSLKAGEIFTLRDLLYALMLPSTNAAANVIARHVAGSVENFTALMNREASDLGLTHSHFMNAHGLDQEDHYSCSHDMARILMEAMKYEALREIMGASYHELPETDCNAVRTMSMGHPMLNGQISCPGVYAGKTGWSINAQGTLVTAVSRNGKDYYLCAMHSEDGKSAEDTLNLIEFIYAVSAGKPFEAAPFVSGLTVRDADENSVVMTFRAENRPESARALWYDTLEGPGTVQEVTFDHPAEDLEFSPNGLVPGRIYTVQVYARDKNGTESGFGTVYLHTGRRLPEGLYASGDEAWYINERGFACTGAVETKNGCYYADEAGRLLKGFVGGKYYAGDDFRIVSGWFKDSGHTYYSGGDGRVVCGKAVIDRKLYTFTDYGALIE